MKERIAVVELAAVKHLWWWLLCFWWDDAWFFWPTKQDLHTEVTWFEKEKSDSNITPKLIQALSVGLITLPNISTGEKTANFSRCDLLSNKMNSVLFGLSFSLFVVIQL